MICQKCGGEISNDFGHTLSFCTNCGERLSFHKEEKTLPFAEIPTVVQSPPKGIFNRTNLLILTASVLLASIFTGLYLMFPDTTNKIVRTLPISALKASEITQVSLSQSGHVGPLVGSDESYSTSSVTRFSGDGAAYRMTGKKTYDAGKKQGSEGRVFEAQISAEDFAKLAEVIAENDFLNETNARGNITDTSTTQLTIKYAKGEKSVITSNTGKDTPEVKAILEAFQTLEKQTNWKAVQ